MKSYWLRLFPEQALAIDDEYVIPASTIRGAIASIAARECIPNHQHDTGPCSANCRYWSLFGDTAEMHISPAHAGPSDEVEPFLATARTCTVHPGFKSTGGHGIFDI